MMFRSLLTMLGILSISIYTQTMDRESTHMVQNQPYMPYQLRCVPSLKTLCAYAVQQYCFPSKAQITINADTQKLVNHTVAQTINVTSALENCGPLLKYIDGSDGGTKESSERICYFYDCKNNNKLVGNLVYSKKYLRLDSSPLCSLAMPHSIQESLKTLDITGNKHLTAQDLRSVVLQCPKLKSLYVSFQKNDSFKSIKLASQSLETVRLTSCNIKKANLYLPNAKQVDLSDNNIKILDVTNIGVRHSQGMPFTIRLNNNKKLKEIQKPYWCEEVVGYNTDTPYWKWRLVQSYATPKGAERKILYSNGLTLSYTSKGFLRHTTSQAPADELKDTCVIS
jgi:Leucine-rich repeat (LRR) protein